MTNTALLWQHLRLLEALLSFNKKEFGPDLMQY